MPSKENYTTGENYIYDYNHYDNVTVCNSVYTVYNIPPKFQVAWKPKVERCTK